MAISNLHAGPELQNTQRMRKRGELTAGLLEWDAGDGSRPWGGRNGPDAASIILLRAHALTSCLSAAQNERSRESEFNLLANNQKALAWDGIGDLIMLAKLLVDEA